MIRPTCCKRTQLPAALRCSFAESPSSLSNWPFHFGSKWKQSQTKLRAKWKNVKFISHLILQTSVQTHLCDITLVLHYHSIPLGLLQQHSVSWKIHLSGECLWKKKKHASRQTFATVMFLPKLRWGLPSAKPGTSRYKCLAPFFRKAPLMENSLISFWACSSSSQRRTAKRGCMFRGDSTWEDKREHTECAKSNHLPFKQHVNLLSIILKH